MEINGESGKGVVYTYVGLARYVKIAYDEPDVDLTYIKEAGSPVGDAGDPYTGYDRFGRTVEMRWQTSGATPELRDGYQWGYDRSSNRTWRENMPEAADELDEHYGYDALNQVTDYTKGNLNINRSAIGGIAGEEQTFTYDPTGNWDRYTMSEDGTETLDQTRVHNQDNQLTQIDGANTGILYDKAGNALKTPPDKTGDWDKYYELTWDGWNRLVEIADKDGGNVAAYQYDGAFRRTTKTVSGTTTHFYYNDQWRPVEEREDASTSASRQYLWGVRPGHRDELILRDRDTDGNGTLDERLYCLMDYYNPTSVVNTSGVVQERYGFTAFGLRSVMDADWVEQSSSSYAFDFGFHGQFLDEESGYYDYGYRYYSPQIGRWINRDPIGEEGGYNLYSYANSNGGNFVDYLGLDYVSKWIGFQEWTPAGEPGKYGLKGKLRREFTYKVRYVESGDGYQCDFGPSGSSTVMDFRMRFHVYDVKTTPFQGLLKVGEATNTQFFLMSQQTVASGRQHEENHMADFEALYNMVNPYADRVLKALRRAGTQRGAGKSECEACLWEEYDKEKVPRPDKFLDIVGRAIDDLNKARDDWEGLEFERWAGDHQLYRYRRSASRFNLNQIIARWERQISSLF